MWDLRKNDVLYKMRGHTDTVTGFKLSPDGSFLLSNAMDNTGTPFLHYSSFIYQSILTDPLIERR